DVPGKARAVYCAGRRKHFSDSIRKYGRREADPLVRYGFQGRVPPKSGANRKKTCNCVGSAHPAKLGRAFGRSKKGGSPAARPVLMRFVARLSYCAIGGRKAGKQFLPPPPQPRGCSSLAPHEGVSAGAADRPAQ